MENQEQLGTFDEASYCAELIAMGLPADEAATVAAKTAQARREALTLNEHRQKLMEAGMGAEQAKLHAEAAKRFMRTPEGKKASAVQMNGFQSLGNILGVGEASGAKAAASPASAAQKKIEEIKATRRKAVEAQARPGETFKQAEYRFLHGNDRPAETPSNGQKTTTSGMLRKPPEGDKQPDFFVPMLYDVGTRDSRNIMDVAVFRLSKKNRRAGEVIRYELPGGEYVQVSAGAAGMASVWDYDLVIMAMSHLTEAMNRYREGRGEKPGRVYRPHVADVLKFCRRSDGGKQKDDLVEACIRLNTTHIAMQRTRRAQNGRTVTVSEGEALISRYKIIKSESGKAEYIEIELADWMHRQVVEGKNPDVLTVHPDYFLIDQGIGRYLYRLARQAAGKTSAKWSFQTIYEHSGSAGAFKEFCRILRKLIEANDLPEYDLREQAGQSGPQLLMTNRSAQELPPVEGDGV